MKKRVISVSVRLKQYHEQWSGHCGGQNFHQHRNDYFSRLFKLVYCVSDGYWYIDGQVSDDQLIQDNIAFERIEPKQVYVKDVDQYCAIRNQDQLVGLHCVDKQLVDDGYRWLIENLVNGG